ncbi:hydrolase [Hyphomicrobium sp.]|jgi:nicotinamidase-related amidase|uniref:hydrolase n=1 Tax=Hyphomicrobium sp. TaxID=82 RepID=UPI0035670CE8
MLQLDPKTTALVLIDLQKGIALRPLAPRPGTEIIDRASELAKRFRSAGAAVVLVNVAFAKDFADAVRVPVDSPMQLPPDGIPDDFSELVVGLAMATDIRVTKRQWGAFYGTELDVQLRRRGIKTIVLGGIATNIGVESTARQAWERNYEIVIAEDITSSLSAEMHAFSITTILPRISRVRKVADITLGSC